MKTLAHGRAIHPTKIAVVHHGAVMGGAPKSLACILSGLSKKDEFDFLVFCPYTEMLDYLAGQSGVKTAPICDLSKMLGKFLIGSYIPYSPSSLKLLIKEIISLPITMRNQINVLNQSMPDIVHLNSSILFVTAICARLLGIPIVWHVRENIAGGRLNPIRFLAGWLIRTLADRVIAISPVEAKKLGQNGRRNISVVYNFVDFSIYDPSRYDPVGERRKLGIPPGASVVLSLGGGGNFRKGPSHLLDAMQHLDKNVHIVIAGQPLSAGKEWFLMSHFNDFVLAAEDLLLSREILETQSWCYKHRVSNTYQRVIKLIGPGRIHCTGELMEVAHIIATSDILLFAGTTPGFPRPIFEAWAMKKPVIALDVDGVRQHVEHGVDGVLVREHSGKAIADAVRRLLASSEEMQNMGEAGYRKANERFRQDVNVEKIAEIYRELGHRRSKKQA